MKNRTLKFILFIIVIIVCWGIGRYYDFDLEYFQEFFSQFPVVLSGLIYVPLYIVLTFFVWVGPKDIFRVLGALLFGPYISTLFVWIAELGNAFVLFHFSRKLGREFIEKKFNLKPSRLDHVKENSSYFGVLTLRINPLVPFRFMDLGAGLTSITFKKYFNGILIASLVRIFWLQSILAGVGIAMFKDLNALQEFLLNNPTVIIYSALYFLVVIICTIIALVMKFLKRKKVKQNEG